MTADGKSFAPDAPFREKDDPRYERVEAAVKYAVASARRQLDDLASKS
jgi:hypothetical protein